MLRAAQYGARRLSTAMPLKSSHSSLLLGGSLVAGGTLLAGGYVAQMEEVKVPRFGYNVADEEVRVYHMYICVDGGFISVNSPVFTFVK